MDKQMSEESSNIQAPWIPQTPMKPISPIYSNTTETKQSNRNQNQNQTEEGKRFDMNGLDQLSFSDLLALANTASEYFSGHKPWANQKTSPTNEDPKKMLQKGDEAVESLSSVSNNVADQIKTPEKPKRRKHRPKVVREAKPKQTPKKPVADGQAIKTPRRKYVRKKVEVNMDQESTPRRKYVRKKVEASKDQEFTPVEAVVEPAVKAKKICRRALDFVDESFKPEKGENQSNSSDTKHAGEMESAPRAKQSDSGDQESKDCLIAAPTTPKRKRSQSKRKGKDLRNNNGGNQDGVDLLMPQPAKRRQGKEPTSDINLPGFEYNGMCEYQQTQWLYVTNLQQEGISAGAMCSTSFVGQQHYAQENVSAFRYESCSLTSQSSANRVLTMEERKGTFQGGQGFESNVCLDKIDTPTKKRTTGHARYRNLSSINKVMEVSEQSHAGCYSTPQSTNNVLVETRVTVSKTKQATKSKKSQTNQKTVLPNLRQYPATFAGLSPDEIWKQLHSVEAISEQLRVLDINRQYSESALVPYSMKSRGNEIILFRGGTGAIVPLVPVKKRRPRPRVDLDNETDRVWKLLMENINSEGIDGTDEQKAKWWENERNVFRGRAESFIARMHLVQGDRRFTPWKGSVVDSIVGVFLTQNVSDHLSSSAFMSLASEYPAPSVPTENCDEGTSSMPSIQITYLDSEESMSTPPVHNPSLVTLNNTQPDEEKDDVNRDETSRSSSEIASSVQESVVKTTDSKVNVDSERKDSSLEVDKKEQTYLVQDPFPYEDSVLTFQNSVVSDAPKNTERAGSSSEINSKGKHFTSFVKLLQDLGSARLPGLGRDVTTADTVSLEESIEKNQYENSKKEVAVSCNLGSLQVSPDTSHGDCSSEVMGFKSLKVATKSSDDSNEPCSYSQQDGDVLSCQKPESSSNVASTKHKEDLVAETLIPDINESTSCLDVQEGTEVPSGPSSRQHQHSSRKELNPVDDAASKAKGKKVLKEEKEEFDWDCLRREAQDREGIREKTARTMDSVDWEAIRTADVSEVAETIKSRGMNHKLAERIQGFLNRLITDHGSIDLEWLRDVPPDKVKEYLLSFRGLGLKSVECVRLLTLHHLAFPVDTNVGRIAVRLGWVPLQPLPESLQLHLLEMYPILESIQKYLWPRLCKLDQKTLYELHYQMITFGKVFCTKSKPNCNACPMRGECRHFASAFASARLSLPGTEKGTGTPDKTPLPLNLPEPLRREQRSEVVKHSEPANRVTCCEPIIEEPASPERECTQVSIADIEDAFYEEDPEEIPTIRLDMDSFTTNLKKIMEHSKELQDGNMSTALVALTAEAASLPMPKLKNISQLRTEHRVYELPDSHPLLLKLGMEKRETDDPCSYLLAIWTPGETANSIQPTVSKCIYQGIGKLCQEETCFSCNNIREARSQTVRGTVLIPCRTAMRGSFPLNGTYFQVNEVFADHASSLTPIDVPREWLWDLPRRTVYFGTSIPSIFKGLTTEIIQQCFWRGHVCVRGFDRKSRGPRPLIARLHFPASKMKSQVNPPNSRAA